MKNILIAALFLIGAAPAFADSDNKSALDRGTYVETAVIAGSSVTGTAFADAAAKRMDGSYFNNTASVVWIGTTTATAQTNHENQRIGFPILSSATFSLDGVMSGAMSFTCNAGIAVCEIRRIEALNR